LKVFQRIGFFALPGSDVSVGLKADGG